MSRSSLVRVGGDPGRPETYHPRVFGSWPEAYAQAYLRACGISLKLLGGVDTKAPTREEAPDPRDVAVF